MTLASRLQSLTKELGTEMIMSETTHAHLGEGELDSIKLKLLEKLPVKGKKELVGAYALAS